ncbi:MAG: CapA family protein [Oscillospiraceae bacterium]
MKKFLLCFLSIFFVILTKSSPDIAVETSAMLSPPAPDIAESGQAVAQHIPAAAQPVIIPEKKEVEITISFLGDCMLASSMGVSYEGSFNYTAKNVPAEYFFEGVINVIGKDDFTVANCENVFTDRPLSEVEKGYSPAFWFKSESENAKIFSKNSIDLVSLANNHTYDYGIAGFEDTISAVEAAEIDWTDEAKPVILEKDGIKIAVLSLVLHRYGSYEVTLEQIKEYKSKADFVIVFFHGGTEKIHTPDEFKINAARSFVDAGADCVVGGHPHVLQPFEEYNGGHIIYSIGNFCYGGSSSPENRTVIFQEKLIFDSNGNLINMSESIIPCYVFTGAVNNYQPSIIKDEETKQQVLDFMYGKSDSVFG